MSDENFKALQIPSYCCVTIVRDIFHGTIITKLIRATSANVVIKIKKIFFITIITILIGASIISSQNFTERSYNERQTATRISLCRVLNNRKCLTSNDYNDWKAAPKTFLTILTIIYDVSTSSTDQIWNYSALYTNEFERSASHFGAHVKSHGSR